MRKLYYLKKPERLERDSCNQSTVRHRRLPYFQRVTLHVGSPDVHAYSSRGQHTLSVDWTPIKFRSLSHKCYRLESGIKSHGLCGRYQPLICFQTCTVVSDRRTDMKVGGDEWPASVQRRSERELNELSLFWGLCMRIHCVVAFYLILICP